MAPRSGGAADSNALLTGRGCYELRDLYNEIRCSIRDANINTPERRCGARGRFVVTARVVHKNV